MPPKRISRVIFQFSDGSKKTLQHDELQRWLNYQMSIKPPALPKDERREFSARRFVLT